MSILYTVRMSDDQREVGLTEARHKIGTMVAQAEHAGRITFLTRNGRHVAAVVPLWVVEQALNAKRAQEGR